MTVADYDYLPASNGSGDTPLIHLTSNRAHGSSIFNVNSVTNVSAKFIATCGTILSTGFIDPTTAINFKGHVSGSTLVIDAYEPGSADPAGGNTADQVIIIKPTTGWANRVASFIKNATGYGTPEDLTVHNLTVGNGLTLPNSVLERPAIDWSSFVHNIKQASNSSSITPTNGVDNDFQSAGAKITFTVSSTAYAFVTVTVGCGSTSDFEHRPEIFLDGSLHSGASYAATIANAGGRASVRSYPNLVILAAGTHTISAGMFISAAVSQIIPANSAVVSAIVLGDVTA